MKSQTRILLSVATTLTFAVTFAGCASSPKLYPNAKYKTVGKDAAEADVKVCQQEADDYVGGKGGKVAKSAGTGAAIGAAVGGVAGLFGGNFGTGLLEGAAIGGAAGATGEALTPDQMKQQYVNRCLAGKGYEVLGWD